MFSSIKLRWLVLGFLSQVLALCAFINMMFFYPHFTRDTPPGFAVAWALYSEVVMIFIVTYSVELVRRFHLWWASL